ncbi:MULTISPECIES: radical SAM protein [Peptoniphilus]|uniref:radical SAM protein n=1 Tax=Peptoniphilus TaxID=162289 RepID=UPI0028FFCF39|nr:MULTISPECIES: radical SAM protein [Peptoniphilus]MBS6611448.1 radical SAM protein [Peptoniphilus harei]MDU1044284.1 radical SAM protein [Peptoniphilus rhinitidis]MDU1955585.1 radical SAM protein [Peptoniphilus lacydonensis]MDU2109245.1 radical SAM protein [Peptoniphilus lacydonensis]MDU2114959.1 radical SAM protein [Peptoniphilus lacydonensis]
MNLSERLKTYGMEQTLKYIHKNPEVNLEKALNLSRKISPDAFKSQMDFIERIVKDKDDVYHKYTINMLDRLKPEVFDKFVVNFLLNAGLFSEDLKKESREKYGCNVPWAILLDPTTACNLKCKGCWAAEYGNSLNLSYDEIDDIIKQGKELGIYFYIFTGGEPLVRKKDVLKICEEHSDCEFLIFTNSTLIDDEFADEMLRLKNIIPAISVEGPEFTTDSRRGDGVYNKVIEAMDRLKAKGLPFGISCCYTSANYDSIISEEFVDEMIERGALFAWYFHFMPVGKGTGKELLPKPEQRAYVYEHLREMRSRKPMFFLDFQNDAEYIGGCIAGGRNYLHINANGDVEPCVFIHYSDSNIREKSLIESLQSPLFMAYHDGQPFNENMLRPCPMLENPEMLRNMVKESKAKSTDILEKEEVDELCDKCKDYAVEWKPVSEDLWENSPWTRKNRNK